MIFWNKYPAKLIFQYYRKSWKLFALAVCDEQDQQLVLFSLSLYHLFDLKSVDEETIACASTCFSSIFHAEHVMIDAAMADEMISCLDQLILYGSIGLELIISSLSSWIDRIVDVGVVSDRLVILVCHFIMRISPGVRKIMNSSSLISSYSCTAEMIKHVCKCIEALVVKCKESFSILLYLMAILYVEKYDSQNVICASIESINGDDKDALVAAVNYVLESKLEKSSKLTFTVACVFASKDSSMYTRFQSIIDEGIIASFPSTINLLSKLLEIGCEMNYLLKECSISAIDLLLKEPSETDKLLTFLIKVYKSTTEAFYPVIFTVLLELVRIEAESSVQRRMELLKAVMTLASEGPDLFRKEIASNPEKKLLIDAMRMGLRHVDENERNEPVLQLKTSFGL